MIDTEMKMRLLTSAGVEAVILQHFTKELACIEAEAFLPFSAAIPAKAQHGLRRRKLALWPWSAWRYRAPPH